MPEIVLVEDNAADAGLVREALEEHTVRCGLTIIGDGERAIDFIDAIDASGQACPDLVILDLNLPRKSGVYVLQHLRASTACNAVPVVVLTSSDNRKDKAAVSPFKPYHYFRKPSDLEEFLTLGAVFKQILSR